MSAFTPEQRRELREIVIAMLLGIERQRATRRMSYIEGDIEYGVILGLDRPSEAQHHPLSPAATPNGSMAELPGVSNGVRQGGL